MKDSSGVPGRFLNDFLNDGLAFLLLFLRTSISMLRKFAAALLLLLAASPFTAPFSTCDAATLFGGTTPLRHNDYRLSFTSADDQSTTLAVSATCRTRERWKLFVSAVVEPVVHQPPALTPHVAATAPAGAPALNRRSHTALRI